MKIPSNGIVASSGEGEKKVVNSELWHACAGPLVSLPIVGTLVVYFPQGHSEQVAATMQKETDGTPSYPNLPSKLICMLQNVTLLADNETNEVYAQMTLQPVSKYDQEALLVSDFGLKTSRQPAELFCKTLTASDTSTHGGFSVPRRAAEKIFPPLDFSMQPPAQEITARDLHNRMWTFRHIFRGQPKRHLLTSGWSVFVSSKRLVAGDAVLFIRDEKSQLLLGTRRASRQQPTISSSVMSSDSMHIGILAAAANAAANNTSFTIFYNPRATSTEFVIPLAKYNKAMYTQVTPGMRFRMMFETEESGVRRYMGTVTSVSDLDPVRWKSSQWRNLQVGWDESAAGERPNRVSIWDIEPVVAPFYICPPPFFGPKFPKHPGFPDDDSDLDNMFKRGVPWISDEFAFKDASSSVFPGLNLVQWMSLQQNQSLTANQSALLPSMVSSTAQQGNVNTAPHSKLLNFQSPLSLQPNNGYLPKQAGQILTTSWPHRQQLTLQQPQQNVRQQEQSTIMPPATSSMTSGFMANLNVQLPAVHPQIQQQQPDTHLKQNSLLASQATVSAASIIQGFLSQQHTGQQVNLVHKPQQQQQMQQISQQNLSEPQLHLQLLEKLQQQQQKQLSASVTPFLEPQSNPKQQRQHQPLPLPQFSGSCNSESTPVNQLPGQQMTSLVDSGQSAQTGGNGLTCTTSLSKSNLQVQHTNSLGNQTSPAALLHNSISHLLPSMEQETNCKPDIQMKHEVPQATAADHLDAASSATSYCFNAGELQQNFPLTSMDDIQSNARSDAPFATAIDALTPDAFLLRSPDSGKDIQNFLSGYEGGPRDIETDLSSGIHSHSFRLPAMLRPGCSNGMEINDIGVLNGGLWPDQTQPMRTYTKVQKRGSVGRTIDVTRYMGYDELRNDLARMFGIEGLLEDPPRTEWKLVYVDHENDMLLVGDDPWEEFVSCVQSIKILSSAEVQQMSLDGDLGCIG